MVATDGRRLRRALCALALGTVLTAAEGERLELRGYGPVRWQAPAAGAPAVHRLACVSPERARRLASKLLADYEQAAGNRIRPGAQGGDLVELAAGGVIAPLVAEGSSEVVVVAAADERALAAAAPAGRWLPRAALRHPVWMDKWDRHCLGVWQAIKDYAQDDRNPTLDAFYRWHGERNLTVQINRGSTVQDLAVNGNQTDYLRRFFERHGVRWQQVEWLTNQRDLYNRNPFLAPVPNPAVASRWIYYGERLLAGNPLRRIQELGAVNALRPTLGDERQLAVLDPDGEIGGPCFPWDRWGQHGPLAQREFVRFLREVRGLDLAGVSRRHAGDPAAYRSWEEVPLPDWRAFYGWHPGAIDLAGEWRFQRDDTKAGLAQGWAAPEWDDRDWVRLHHPGDPLVLGLPAASGPLWMRRTVEVPPGRLPGRALLSVALLTTKPVQVFVNGALVDTLAPRFHTAPTVGQVDVSAALATGRRLTIALRLAAGDAPYGPVLLTDRAIDGYPTADPRLNALRFDQAEFIDWAIAQAVGGTLAAIRSVEPDRPIKVHAYEGSAWGLATTARYGGYTHHTGSSAGWQWCVPKQYGLSRGLQDSSETSGPVSNLRELTGLWGSVMFMGKNAHDYFINLQSITRDPAMRAYFEARMPAIRQMGRVDVLASPIAVMRPCLNQLYTGEFGRWENWRYFAQVERGGEMVPLLDEVRVREGNLGRYAAIVDEGTTGWDPALAAALRTYVEAGGILLLNAQSGRHDFVVAGVHPAEALAGSRLGAALADSTGRDLTFAADPGLPGLSGRYGVDERIGEIPHRIEPGPGAVVAATWPDGSPALIRRDLGRGRVWLCGAGVHPHALLGALAAAHGSPIWARATGADLLRAFVSNDGGEDLLMVRSSGGKPVTVTWHLDRDPGAIHDPLTGAMLPARIDGTTATVELAVPDGDFAWIASRRSGPDRQFRHWLDRQREMWSGTAPGVAPPAAPPFRRLDLNRGWSMARTATWEEAAALSGAAAEERLQPAQLVLWDAPGTPPGGPCALYRRDFDLPAGWERDTIRLHLRGQVHDTRLHGFDGRNAVRLNGVELWTGGRADWLRLETAGALRAGPNRLEIVHQGPGLMPGISLLRTVEPETVIDLAGSWRAVAGCNQEQDVRLPGTVRAAFLYRDIELPVSVAGREIWLTAEGNADFAIINGRLRYWEVGSVVTAAPSTGLELDITPDLRPGAVNRIVLGSSGTMAGWKMRELVCGQVRLGLHTPGRWSGTPTRQALSARELAAMARDQGAVGLYPLIQPSAPRPPPATETVGGAPPPAPGLDVVFAADGIRAEGRPLRLLGAAAPFAEAGVAGVFLHADGQRTSGVVLPRERLRQLFAGGRTTLRTWIKPLAAERTGGSLFNWGSWYLDWAIDDDGCRFSAADGRGRLEAAAVLHQRRWQSLTLVLDGRRALLYVDGMPASTAELPTPLTGHDADAFLGCIENRREHLNARIAAFSVWDQALDAGAVRRLHRAERARFANDPPEERLHLEIGPEGVRDASDIPAGIRLGPTAAVGEEDGRRHLALPGPGAWISPREQARAALFCAPFTIETELRLRPGAQGVLLRRHHLVLVEVTADGSVVLDASIGRKEPGPCRFPAALRHGVWTRLSLAYDGRTARLQVDDAPAVEKPYVTSIFPSDYWYPVSLFGDATCVQDPQVPDARNLACDLRSLRVLHLADGR